MWEIANGRCLRTFDETSKIDAITFSKDGHSALSCGADRYIQLWKVGENINVYKAPFEMSEPVDYTNLIEARKQYDELMAIARTAILNNESASAIGYVKKVRDIRGRSRDPAALNLWRKLSQCNKRIGLQGGWPELVLEGHSSLVNSVCFSPDGCYALSGSDDHTLKYWDLSTGKCLATFVGHAGWVFSVSLSPDGKYAISGSEDHKVKLWEVATGECLQTFDGHSHEVNSVCFSPDARTVLSGGGDGKLKFWDVETGLCINTIRAHWNVIASVVFSPDGQRVLSGSVDKTLKLWAGAQCVRTFTGHSNFVKSACFRSDGLRVLSGSYDNTLRLWGVVTGHLIYTYTGHVGFVSSVCFSPDMKYALSGSYDRTMRVWDIRKGCCVAILLGHTDEIRSVAFSPDGCYALSGGKDKAIRLWHLDWDLADIPDDEVLDPKPSKTVVEVPKEMAPRFLANPISWLFRRLKRH